nr:MAG TPA: hypothetical protein [Caudoviricetes sp.]
MFMQPFPKSESGGFRGGILKNLPKSQVLS